MSSLTIAVLSGGISHEREVSLRSGRRVADALISRGHSVSILDPDANLFSSLAALEPQVIWPALHGSSGEDGALLDLLRAAGYAYVGPSAEAARLAWSKPVAKTIVRRAGISTADSVTVAREAFRELGAASVLELIDSELGKHLVVKPSSGGSSQGVSNVETAEDLPRAMVEAFTYSDVALIERFIPGTEVSVTVHGSGSEAGVLPVVEIVPLDGVYSFEARYNAGETTFFVPARLSEAVTLKAQGAAVVAHNSLGLDGLSRIDLIIDDAGEPWFLEANALPGLTETSSAPLAIEASGKDLGEFYESLVLKAQ